MAGRPIVSNAKAARMPDGSTGLYVDQTPLQRIMDRWRVGDFDGMEREFAKAWRSDQTSIDLESLIRETKHLRLGDGTSLEAVIEQAHDVVRSRTQLFASRHSHAVGRRGAFPPCEVT
jgi:hypothetical protein